MYGVGILISSITVPWLENTQCLETYFISKDYVNILATYMGSNLQTVPAPDKLVYNMPNLSIATPIGITPLAKLNTAITRPLAENSKWLRYIQNYFE